MKKRESFMSVRTMLIAVFLLIILIPIFTLSFFVNNSTHQEIYDNFVDSTRQQVIQVDDFFTMYFSNLKQDCDFLTKDINVKKTDKTITSYIEKERELDGYITMTPSVNGGIESEIFKVFEQYGSTHPEVDCVYIGTEYGGYVQWPEAKLPNQYDPRKRPWYNEIMKEKDIVLITRPYYTIAAEDTPVVTTGKIIVNEAGESVGIQAIDVSLDDITKIVKEMKIGKSGYIILTDSTGTILAHPQKTELNFKHISELNNTKLNNIREITNDNFEIELFGKQYYADVYTSPNIGWKFISIIEKKELMQSVNNIKEVIYILASVLAIVFIVIAVIFTNRFSNPLITAAKQLKLMEHGDFTKEIPKELLNTKGELGTFVKSVDSMQNVINDLMAKVSDSPATVMNYSKYLEDISEQAQAATREAASAIKQFVETSESEAKEKKLIEIELEKTTESFIQAQQIGHIGNWEWDIQNNTLWLSDEMYRIFGLEAKEMEITNKMFMEHIHPEDMEYVKQGIKHMLHGEPYSVEFRFNDFKGKQIWLYHSGNVVCDTAGKSKYLFGISQNVTEKKDALIELKKINENLKEIVEDELKESRNKDAVIIYQSRLAKMGEMIGLIAHQWKQPLNNLNLILANVKDAYEYKELTKEDLDNSIYNSKLIINQMSQTIDDFRHFYKPQRNKEIFSLSETINFALGLMEEGVKRNKIDISINTEEDSMIFGYSNEFCQVIFNVLDNAKDALVESGIDKKEIMINIYAQEDTAIVEINDNGGGMDNKDIDKIFEPYFTTKVETRGTGIGLYMSKMIIEDHMSGKIICKNTSDGMCFQVKIPKNEVSKSEER